MASPLDINESKLAIFHDKELKYPIDLEEVFASLFHLTTICLWIPKELANQRTADFLEKVYSLHNYTFTHVVYGYNVPLISANHCFHNVLFNYKFFYFRVFFKDDKPSERHVFLIIDNLGTDEKGVQKLNMEMFRTLWTANVVLLTEHGVYKLSSPYFPPRRLEAVGSVRGLRDERVTDLRGRVVNVATFNCSLFSIVRGPMNSGLHDGIEMRMMQQLALQLNMTPNYILADGWGWMFLNGTWKGGLAGLLQDGRAEIGYCNIWNTLRYNRAVALGPPWTQMYCSFMVPRPILIHGYWMTVVALFHRAVWFLLVMFCFFVTFLFWKFKKGQPKHALTDLVESMLTVFGTFLGQSIYLSPGYAFGRRIVVSWCIFSFFMASILNNMMISRLMVPHLSEKIDTVKDFVLGGYRWGNEVYSNFEQEIFFNPEDPWHKQMENQYQKIPPHEMMTALRSRRVAFPVQRLGNEYVFIVLKSIDQSEIDSFRIMKEPINQFYVSMIFSKMSPMLEICRNPLLRFMQAGLIIHWKNEVIRNFGSHKAARLLVDPAGESVSEFQPLTIDNNMAAFRVLMYGWCLSLGVFLVELLSFRRSWRRFFKEREKVESIPTYDYCE